MMMMMMMMMMITIIIIITIIITLQHKLRAKDDAAAALNATLQVHLRSAIVAPGCIHSLCRNYGPWLQLHDG
jgi:predicted metal-dependent hydrolase